jgi:formyltetrahydrofolate-dependent phosphoribosylglycinamide formyltransferase
MKKRIAVLISGNGSNLQALIDATHSNALDAKIDLVLSNSAKAYGLQRAANVGIATEVMTLKSYKDVGKSRVEFDQDLALKIRNHFNGSPDIIVLAGFMHILSPEFLNAFPGIVINLHPALPGAFDGINAISRAYEAFKSGSIAETGVMVHKVIPQVDKGECILVEKVPIYDSDCLSDLEDRIHKVEHRLIVEAIKKFLET